MVGMERTGTVRISAVEAGFCVASGVLTIPEAEVAGKLESRDRRLAEVATRLGEGRLEDRGFVARLERPAGGETAAAGNRVSTSEVEIKGRGKKLGK
jgi:hypothetical protein